MRSVLMQQHQARLEVFRGFAPRGCVVCPELRQWCRPGGAGLAQIVCLWQRAWALPSSMAACCNWWPSLTLTIRGAIWTAQPGLVQYGISPAPVCAAVFASTCASNGSSATVFADAVAEAMVSRCEAAGPRQATLSSQQRSVGTVLVEGGRRVKPVCAQGLCQVEGAKQSNLTAAVACNWLGGRYF